MTGTSQKNELKHSGSASIILITRMIPTRSSRKRIGAGSGIPLAALNSFRLHSEATVKSEMLNLRVRQYGVGAVLNLTAKGWTLAVVWHLEQFPGF